MSNNPYSPELLQLFRFENVGVYNNLVYRNGKYVDLILMQLPREKWIERNLGAGEKISDLN